MAILVQFDWKTRGSHIEPSVLKTTRYEAEVWQINESCGINNYRIMAKVKIFGRGRFVRKQTPELDVSTEYEINTAGRDVRFLAAIDAEVRFMQRTKNYGRVCSYTSARCSFARFLSSTTIIRNKRRVLRKGDIRLTDITAGVIIEYGKWLEDNGVVKNTVSFYMRILRAIFNRAVRKHDIIMSNPFADVYTGNDRTEKRNVNMNVIQQLVNLDLSQYRSLSYARDLFLFSFLTRGMPFVDIAYLHIANIQGRTMTYRRHKTEQSIKQTLDPQAVKIVERWHEPDSEMVFPILDITADEETIYRQYRSELSLQNKRLKKLSEMIGGNVHLTSYVARHTWATVAWECDIPLSEISMALGHTSERTTRIYLNISDSLRLDRHCQRVAKKLKFANTQ